MTPPREQAMKYDGPQVAMKPHVMISRTATVAGLVLAGLVGCGEEPAPEGAVTPAALVPCGGPGTICTWAGNGLQAFNGDGLTLAESAFYWPLDLEFSPDGRAYLVDWNNHRIRRVEADGRIQTVIGNALPGDGPADQSDNLPEGAPGLDVELNHPTDLQFMPDGTLLVAAWHNHKIRTFDPITGRVRVLCGAGPGASMRDVAKRSLLNQPKSVAIDSRQNVYVADSRNQRIRMIESEIMDTVAGSGKKGYEGDGGTPLLASFYMQQIDENPEPGGSITVDGDGRVYLADTYNNRIRRIDFTARTVTTVAGNGTAGFGGDGGPAIAASLNLPRDIELGPDGRLFIADTNNQRIRAVDLTTGIITTIAGSGEGGFDGDGGPATAAKLQRPFGIGFDRDGQLYVADTFNNRFRKVVLR
jgi:hypothetical protein